MEVRGLIFDIQRFAIHDGPGIRTTLFLKGCPLVCWWCHNPESISPRPQLVAFPGKCIGCGACFQVCPAGAHERLADGSRIHHRERCTLCGRCAEACCAEALVIEGREITVEEAVAELAKDAPFYANSGGGVTLSGGEPLRQADFTLEVLRLCTERGFHTALDTSGHAPWEDVERVLPFTDLVLYDLKHADPEAHRTYTGISNERILDNLGRISRQGKPLEIRIPVIPGINDDLANIDASAAILAGLAGVTRVALLPYHRLGEAKYARLGRAYRLPGVEPPPRERMEELAGRLRAAGLPVDIEG